MKNITLNFQKVLVSLFVISFCFWSGSVLVQAATTYTAPAPATTYTAPTEESAILGINPVTKGTQCTDCTKPTSGSGACTCSGGCSDCAAPKICGTTNIVNYCHCHDP